MSRELSERLIGQLHSRTLATLKTLAEQESFTVSPDGSREAYVTKVGKKVCVVVDGKKEKQYDAIMGRLRPQITFSSDSKRVAYGAKVEVERKWLVSVTSKQFVVVDGEEGKQYDAVIDSAGRTSQRPGYDVVAFSLDSKRMAYGAKVGKKACVVVDGEEGKQYDKIEEVTFSPDSKRVAYGVMESLRPGGS